jgi:hypothetical protein
VYNTPGFADELSPELVSKWNEEIHRQYSKLDSDPKLHSKFFSIDPGALANSTDADVGWFGNPAEPEFCQSKLAARQLSDWGATGRHGVQNEYCEYAVIQAIDSNGSARRKRVQISTELREYWVMMAVSDPNTVRELASTVLGIPVEWMDLYGVADPFHLSEKQRRIAFSTLVAGNGKDSTLPQSVPLDPTGRLNNDYCLFMTHPINGLDDLIYIVLFGAKPYAQRVNGQRQQATREQIFRTYDVEHLACRHADPAAAMGACGVAYQGRTVAFKDPLGMYIKSFAKDKFTFEGKKVPDEWIRFSRGKSNLWQRLEFGPRDEDPHFLDEIVLSEGAQDSHVIGGYDVVSNIEVGPLISVGPPTPLADTDFVDLTTSTATIKCSEAKVCQRIAQLKAAYDQAHPSTMPGLRGIR